MSELIQDVFRYLIPAIIISITTIITVRISIKHFYSQRWWEKKAEAYSRIIESLSYLQYYFNEMFDMGVNIKTINEKNREELLENYKKTREDIIKTTAIGTFIVSDKTIEALRNLLKELEKKDLRGNWIEDIDKCYGLVQECIEKIRKYSKEDLQKR